MLCSFSITCTFSQAILEAECFFRPFFSCPHASHVVLVGLVPLELNLPLASDYRLDAVFVGVGNVFVILMVLMKQTVLQILALLQVISISRVYDPTGRWQVIWASLAKKCSLLLARLVLWDAHERCLGVVVVHVDSSRRLVVASEEVGVGVL